MRAQLLERVSPTWFRLTWLAPRSVIWLTCSEPIKPWEIKKSFVGDNRSRNRYLPYFSPDERKNTVSGRIPKCTSSVF
jgi:hypothetical protein